ncbi:carboxylesterase/lipase family protein [Kribbella sp.]|uniref:carboxylesterase/lipase family protein n=1 Tax=Kribbella sp. TaxID=1871183 RepID=UPI002D44EE7E|nr:carboxylesterase family protein [Kribbella sp.]HZX08416.1 carboxylesterase family protein [Kribbella sp.]
MRTVLSRRAGVTLAAATAALAAAMAGLGLTAEAGTNPAATSPVVATGNGIVRGVAVDGTAAFRGIPYAAAPTGELRWRAPRPAASWPGVRDATKYAPGCPQGAGIAPPGALSEDCLYLNVSTAALHPATKRPVLVWIHGGGLTADSGSNYDGTKLAKAGAVVVTINYRLGALGFLAHPALASRPGGASGNYGLMDQQAALRWVQRNIGRFGGDPHNVTIAGESAGGLSVLAHVTAPSSKGLFQRAIVESGAFALEQEPLAKAEVTGEEFAAKVGCADQTAACLRKVPVQALVDNAATASVTIPGVVDGAVLKESIGTALAAGRFNHVPVLNGSNHDEEALFTLGGRVVSRGYNVGYTSPVTPQNYEANIAAALRVIPAQAAAIAADYPLSAYPSPDKAFGTLIGDATFACGAQQVTKWTSAHAYEFNDDTAPFLFAPAGALSVATHGSEMWYLFDLPNAPFPAPLNAQQTALADSMRAAWVKFAATGNPSTAAVPWPASGRNGAVLSLKLPAPQVSTDFAARHHCATFAQNLDKVK